MAAINIACAIFVAGWVVADLAILAGLINRAHRRGEGRDQ